MSKLYVWTQSHVYGYMDKIVADYCSYPVETVIIPKDDPLNKDKEFKAKKSHGAFPFLEEADGSIIFESGAIA